MPRDACAFLAWIAGKTHYRYFRKILDLCCHVFLGDMSHVKDLSLLQEFLGYLDVYLIDERLLKELK